MIGISRETAMIICYVLAAMAATCSYLTIKTDNFKLYIVTVIAGVATIVLSARWIFSV